MSTNHPPAALITLHRRLPRRRGVRRLLWTLLLVLAFTSQVEVSFPPLTLGPVTVQWTLDLAVPALGR